MRDALLRFLAAPTCHVAISLPEERIDVAIVSLLLLRWRLLFHGKLCRELFERNAIGLPRAEVRREVIGTHTCSPGHAVQHTAAQFGPGAPEETA